MSDPATRHPTHRELADLVDGVLAGARLERVHGHVSAGCNACDQAIAVHGRLVGAIASGPLPPVPRAVLRRARMLYAGARVQAVVGRVREVLAALVLDQRSALSSARAPALRSGPGDSRRMLWTVGDAEIVVGITCAGGRADVLGEVLFPGDEAAPLSLRLEGPAGSTLACHTDADGGFAARAVQSGTYVLRGEIDGSAFRTPPFVID